MGISTAKYTLDVAALPVRDETLRIRFDTQVVNGKNRLLYLYPASDMGAEPTYARFAAGMSLRTGDGIAAQRQGQLIVTGRRLLGMFTSGAVGNQPLNGGSGSIFAFSIEFDDVATVTPKTNWRGRPVEATIASNNDLDPWFSLHVLVVAASLKNDGKATPTTIQAFLSRITPEGRRELQGS